MLQRERVKCGVIGSAWIAELEGKLPCSRTLQATQIFVAIRYKFLKRRRFCGEIAEICNHAENAIRQ